MKDFYGTNRTPEIRLGNAPMTWQRALKIGLALGGLYVLYRVGEILFGLALYAGYLAAVWTLLQSIK